MARCALLHTFSGQFLQRTRRAGLLTPDGVVGVIETGSVDRPGESSGYSSLLRQTLAKLPEGTWELVCIPATTTPTCLRPARAAGFSRTGAAPAALGGTAAVS